MTKSGRSKAAHARWRADAAVSPIIGSLIVITIAVILSVTAYAAFASFGSNQQPPTKSITLSSQELSSGGLKVYAVSGATPGMRWNDLEVLVDGVAMTMVTTGGCPTPGPTEWVACAGGATEGPDDGVHGGDLVKVPASPDARLDVVDVSANSVAFTTVVR